MEDLKKIIAVFIKDDPESISDNTLINSKVIPGSILLHRMYAAINKAGYNVKNYSNINTYGELIASIDGKSIDIVNYSTTPVPAGGEAKVKDNSLIGVDIESIDNLPLTNDFREHEFYTDNFSVEEIAYSLLKPNPYETFAGLFSAKEALCKVNDDLRDWPFNKINIRHDETGKPIFQDYSISISHSNNYSVAVALSKNNFQMSNISGQEILNSNKDNNILSNRPVALQGSNGMVKISLVLSLFSFLATLVLFYLYLKR